MIRKSVIGASIALLVTSAAIFAGPALAAPAPKDVLTHYSALAEAKFQDALSTAKALDAAGPRPDQPLFGVPMTIKESYDVAGMPTTWGDPALKDKPLALAGFSFGGYVAAQAHARLSEAAANRPELVAPKQLVLVSPATSRYEVPEVPAHTLLVEGEQDDVVPLASILDWARPQGLPITVVPGTGHFFHGKLTVLREVVLRHLRAAAV